MFTITNSSGFHLTFENGITLSTQFGGGSYCSNHDMNIISSEHQVKDFKSKDAEIAIWDADGEWLTRQAYKELFGEDIGDDVKGYVELEEWLKVLDWCRAYKPKQAKAEVKDK